MQKEFKLAWIGVGGAIVAALIAPAVTPLFSKEEKPPKPAATTTFTIKGDVTQGGIVAPGGTFTITNHNAPSDAFEAYHQGRQFGEEDRRKVAEENEKLKKQLAALQGKGETAEENALLQSLQEAQNKGEGERALQLSGEYEALTQQRGAEAKAITARILFTQYRFAEAIAKMQEAAAQDPENPLYQYELLKYAYTNHDFKAGRTAGEKALAAYRKLAREKPAEYQGYLAGTLNNLGILLTDENRRQEALKAYEEALSIRRKLTRANPSAYEPDVAETLNNLGILHDTENRRQEALKAYEEALNIYRKLAIDNPATYQPYVATTLNNLGALHDTENRRQEALKVYEEALTIYRKLAIDNPAAYQPYVATTLNNLGALHYAENRRQEALKAYEEALSIRRKLASDIVFFLNITRRTFGRLCARQSQNSGTNLLSF